MTPTQQTLEFSAITSTTASDASLTGTFILTIDPAGVNYLECEFELTAPIAFFGPNTS